MPVVTLSPFSTALGFDDVIPISQMRAQRHREVELPAQGCRAGGRAGTETWAPDLHPYPDSQSLPLKVVAPPLLFSPGWAVSIVATMGRGKTGKLAEQRCVCLGEERGKHITGAAFAGALSRDIDAFRELLSFLWDGEDPPKS